MTDTATDRYYWADGRKIALHPSPAWVAVHAPDAGMAAALDASGETSGVLALPDRDLILVKADAAALAPAGPAGEDRQPTTPVYETDTPEEVYLVPVGEVIVKFHDGTSAPAASGRIAAMGATVVQTDYPEPGAYLISVGASGDSVDVANTLHEAADVDYAEPNFAQVVVQPGPVSAGNGSALLDRPVEINLPVGDGSSFAGTLDGTTAPDPNLSSQWGLAKIRAAEAWAITAGVSTISVAVVDEGVDLTHEDLSLKLPGFDAYDGDNNPQPNGNDAHGTACAGIVAAVRDNGRGGAGVAPGCRVLPVRIAKGIGGGFWDTDSAKVANGIRTAVDRGADVLSNSYSVAQSTAVTNAFTYAATNGRGGRGCAMAAASGNTEGASVIYPARLSPTVPGLVAVGASNEWDQRKSPTSLDGETWWGSSAGPEVDVVAPGVHIFTTDIMGAAGYAGGNYTPKFNGTSSATPHVAGLMALILSLDPELRGWEVEELVKMTTVDLGVAGRDNFTGYGRIDARRALEAASKLWYEITPAVEFIGGAAFMRLNARLYNPGINTIRLDSFTLTSHSPDWTQEIDRIEYRPNPGNVLAPRAGQDVRFNRVLLKANGTPAAWSYRWSASWSYTFWRPSAPGLPLAVNATAGPGLAVNGSARGGADLGSAAPGSSGAPAPASASEPAGANGTGDGAVALTIDAGRSITITVR